MTYRVSQTEHDRIVGLTVQHLQRNGYLDIRADIPGYPTPSKLNWKGRSDGHIPDVTADGIIVEVETADSLDATHTADQWRLFSAWAKLNGRKFVVVVPAAAKNAAARRVQELGVTAEVWTA